MKVPSPSFVVVRCAAVCAVVWAAVVPAQTTKPSGCESAVTTAAMRTCAASSYATAQQQLDSAYRDLLKHLDNAQKLKLRIAQRAWLRFRDANADFQASVEQGGTLAPLVKIGSLIAITKARTDELKKEALP